MSTREERLELRLQGDAAYTTRPSSVSVTASALKNHHFRLYGQGNISGLPSNNQSLKRSRDASVTSNLSKGVLMQERREMARQQERMERQREQERMDREELIPDSKKAPQVGPTCHGEVIDLWCVSATASV